MRQFLVILIKGFCMGAADVVPGVSGGTMAFILGIYARLVHAIRAFDVALLRLLARGRLAPAARHVDLALLVPLLAGIFCALLFFTRVVSLPRLIETRPEVVYSLFFGLILASVAVLLVEMGRLRLPEKALLGLGVALGYAVVNLVPVSTPEATWFIFVSGALAICAMILPGISGSFILLVLRKYTYVFDAVGRLDLGVLAPFALGCVVGLLLFSRVLDWLLERWYRATIVTIAGLLLGTLWMIWPFQERSYELVRGKRQLIHSAPVWPAHADLTLLLAVLLMAAGFLAVWGLHRAARRSP